MSKLKGILLTQGMHGMISQVEGLAKALDLDFTHHTVELNSFWKAIPPKLMPISQKVYKKIKQKEFDVIISCGRKSVIPSIHLKNIANRKVFNIAISTTASVFALFCFPYTAKLIFEPEVASYVALTISCFSIAMLIPRTQANKNMPLLGSHNLTLDNIVLVNNKYCKLIIIQKFCSFYIY